jgi:hypothetical protein
MVPEEVCWVLKFGDQYVHWNGATAELKESAAAQKFITIEDARSAKTAYSTRWDAKLTLVKRTIRKTVRTKPAFEYMTKVVIGRDPDVDPKFYGCQGVVLGPAPTDPYGKWPVQPQEGEWIIAPLQVRTRFLFKFTPPKRKKYGS